MKFWLAAAFLVCFGSSARAQLLGNTQFNRPAFGSHRVLIAQADAPAPAPAPAPDPLAKAEAAIATAQAVAAGLPAGPWAGRLDLSPDFGLGGWQSLKSTDEAFGISKRVFHLDKGGVGLVNVGLFVGGEKPVVYAPAQPVKFLGGATVAVPGHTLDVLLGTKWGDMWAPALKTGLLCAYDLTRLRQLGVVPDFVGVGASYFFTFGQAAATN